MIILNMREARRILAAIYEARQVQGQDFLSSLEEIIVSTPAFVDAELAVIGRVTEMEELTP